MRLEVGGPPSEGGDARLIEKLGVAGDVKHAQRENGTLAVTIHTPSARDFVPAAFDAARAAGAAINHVEVVPVTLEDVFLSLTGRALRE